MSTDDFGKRLVGFIERVERLAGEKADIATDMKEVYAEAKRDGFDVKTLRRIVTLRKLDPTDRRAELDLLERYMTPLGWNATPLGKAAAAAPAREPAPEPAPAPAS